MRPVLALVALALSACATAPQPIPVPPVRVERVDIPIHVACAAKSELGPEPEYADSDEALMDLPLTMAMTPEEWIVNWFYLTKQLTSGRLQRIKRDREKSVVLDKC